MRRQETGENIMNSVEYVRLYEDARGGSHMQKSLQIELTSSDFVPPAPPIDVSSFKPASSYGFLRSEERRVGKECRL